MVEILFYFLAMAYLWQNQGKDNYSVKLSLGDQTYKYELKLGARKSQKFWVQLIGLAHSKSELRLFGGSKVSIILV